MTENNIFARIEQAKQTRGKTLNEQMKARKELATTVADQLKALEDLPVQALETFEYSVKRGVIHYALCVKMGCNPSYQHYDWRVGMHVFTSESESSETEEDSFRCDQLLVNDRLAEHLQNFFLLLSAVQLEEFRISFTAFVVRVTS